jgi:hypothetical protein
MHRVVRAAVLAVFAMLTIAVLVVGLGPGDDANPLDVEIAALGWVGGDSVSQGPRRDGDNWEVDVIRPDGSMVQVNLSDDLELQGLDEEYGPAGTLAEDEATGPTRARAVQVAFAEVGPGEVVGVEREPGGRLEVGVLRRGGRQVEVELDRRFDVVRVEKEDPRDE